MHPQDNHHEAADQLRSWMENPSPAYGFQFLDGPSPAGKTELLRALDDATSGTCLVDAKGLSTEELVDAVMQELGIPYGDRRSLSSLASVMKIHKKEHNLSRVVLVANTQWAGSTRDTTEPRRAANALAGGFGIHFKKTGVRFVIEVDSDVQDLSPRNRSPITLTSRFEDREAPFSSLSLRQRTAVQALALAESRSLRFEEWIALCSVLGTKFDGSELQAVAGESALVSVDSNSDLPVSLTRESDAHRLRGEFPAGKLHAFHHDVVDHLLACGDDDPLADYLARALPAHAAAGGRFEELLSVPRALVKCDHTALIEALPVAFPDGVPAGSHAADLHYLDALGLAPSSHAEWLSLLHLLSLSQGDPERARALTESAGPLPWRTVWTNWRAPGHLHARGSQTDAIDALRADVAAFTVTSTTANGVEQTWHANTGQLTEPGSRGDHADSETPTEPTPQPLWRAEPSWNLARLQLANDPDVSRVVQAPKIRDAACVGNLVVMAGDRGLYAIEPNLHYTESTSLRALPSAGPRGRITPRPYDETACRPTRARVLDIFSANAVPTLMEERLPTGLTHEPTRRFLTDVGFPAVSDFYSLHTHNIGDIGLVEHAWEGTKAFQTPVGDGPFYELGTWIGGVLLLDGPTGRVLRQTRPSAVDGDHPGEPLAGSSLAQFVAMVCLQWEYMLAYTTSGGLDSAELLAELTAWLSAQDPAAAATQNWGHVLDSDNFYYL
ncbi:SUKH-4 family immunity protein [Streptomyces glomeratus]|uniref:SUKH-4 immunity protein n=1 Tax=Streptomyces glomeratus TaxID=284452 RepID=A0ABP6M387_9ACTN|nr:SUKH-4 family immunity protein [Streptomyces glomeratus]MCF1511546.1 SUKH-4 family immunity protein [Streptomyces glomeratus]